MTWRHSYHFQRIVVSKPSRPKGLGDGKRSSGYATTHFSRCGWSPKKICGGRRSVSPGGNSVQLFVVDVLVRLKMMSWGQDRDNIDTMVFVLFGIFWQSFFGWVGRLLFKCRISSRSFRLEIFFAWKAFRCTNKPFVRAMGCSGSVNVDHNASLDMKKWRSEGKGKGFLVGIKDQNMIGKVYLTAFPCLPSPCLFFYLSLPICFPFQILCLHGTSFLPKSARVFWAKLLPRTSSLAWG